MEKDTITREEIYALVWESPLKKVAEHYNVSENELRKKCKEHNIPFPFVGYWSKIKNGKNIVKEPLPTSSKEAESIVFHFDNEINVASFGVPFMLRLKYIKEELKKSFDLPLKIPTRLSNPDDLVKSTKEHFLKDKKENSQQSSNLPGNFLDIQVSKESQDRALLLMDYFVKIIRARGHEIKIENGRTKVVMFTVEEDISIREKYDVIKLDKYPYTKYNASGNLVFRAKPSYHQTWQDSKNVSLEEKVISIIAWLEARARDIKSHWDENARMREEEENRQRIEKEIKDNKERELKKFKTLLEEAERWQKARFVREYIDFLESNNIQNHDDFENWIIWAKKKADWYDPLSNKKDDILGLHG